jgi:hypothetical protein
VGRNQDQRYQYRFRIAVMLTVCAVGAVSLGADVQVTLPRTSGAPTLDGTMAAGEWDDAAAVSGVIDQLDGVVSPRPVTFWIMVGTTNVYVAQRSTVYPAELDAKTPPLWLNRDSSFVVALAPGRIGRGEEPSHFLLRCSVDKQLWTREIFWKLAGVRLTYPHPSWPAGATVEHTIEDGVWVAEMAIPLGSLKVEDLKDGEEMLLGALATGARGGVGSTYNVATPLYLKLIAAFDRGDLAAARILQAKATPINQSAGGLFRRTGGALNQD